MANSQPISELSAYNAGTATGAQFNDSDLFIVSSKKLGNDYKSYSITFGELYAVIKNKLMDELKKSWENLPVVSSLSDANNLDHGDIANCLGPGVAQDLSALIDSRLADYKPTWQE